ncbi:unnamed protein product, partial [Diplocarpon coronariae]
VVGMVVLLRDESRGEGEERKLMSVFSYNPVRVTISNNEFDGATTTSATCNKEHYCKPSVDAWNFHPHNSLLTTRSQGPQCLVRMATRSPSTRTTGMIFPAAPPSTLPVSYPHPLTASSARYRATLTRPVSSSPQASKRDILTAMLYRLGGDNGKSTTQATNNFFENSLGHSFEIYPSASVLIEGNQFKNVETPMDPSAEKLNTIYNVPDAASASACTKILGRACVMNAFVGATTKWPSLKNEAVLNTFKGVSEYLVKPYDVGKTEAQVKANAGVGRI